MPIGAIKIASGLWALYRDPVVTSDTSAQTGSVTPGTNFAEPAVKEAQP